MPGLPSSFVPRVRRALEDCVEFRDPNALYDLFSLYDELRLWRNGLRHERSVKAQVMSVMAYLAEKYLITGENGLVILLKLLSENSSNDSLAQELEILASELEPLMRKEPGLEVSNILQPATTSINSSTDFLIITALAEERDAVLESLSTYQTLSPSSDDIHTYYRSSLVTSFPDGRTSSYNIVVTSPPQMGRLHAGLATRDAIRKWNPRYVLLVGIAGGVAENQVQIGDILIARQIADYSLQKIRSETVEVRWEFYCPDQRLLIAAQNLSKKVWLPQMPQNRPAQSEPNLHIGSIASGDKSIASSQVVKGYHSTLPKLIGVEMEAGGVAAGAFLQVTPTPFFMVRAVSDLADENESSEEVEKWRPYARAAAAAYSIALLKSGPVPSQV